MIKVYKILKLLTTWNSEYNCIIFCWNKVDLQWCVNFWCIEKWFNYIHICNWHTHTHTYIYKHAHILYIQCVYIYKYVVDTHIYKHEHIYMYYVLHVCYFSYCFVLYLLKDIEFSPLCYTIGPCYYFVIYFIHSSLYLLMPNS